MPQLELQALIDANDQPFVVIDREYRIVAANQRYGDAYGATPDAIVGRHCYDVSHHATRPCHENGEQCPHRALFEQGLFLAQASRQDECAGLALAVTHGTAMRECVPALRDELLLRGAGA